MPHVSVTIPFPVTSDHHSMTPLPSNRGDMANVHALLAAIRTLKQIEQAQRPATEEERQTLARFPGCGPLALVLFPDPVTGRYKKGFFAQAAKSVHSRD